MSSGTRVLCEVQRNAFWGVLSLAVLAFGILCPAANGQTGEWAWMNGPQTPQPSVYGTLGTPDAQNIPGDRSSTVSWTDNSGNLWLFGGEGSDSTQRKGYLNDLWKFSPATNQWVWMGGSETDQLNNSPGVYGTLGTPAPGNIPSGRTSSVGWKDSNGNLWLFGGYNYGAINFGVANAYLNDLWKFNPSTNEWAWMGGSNADQGGNSPGVYGTLGTAAAGNIPGGRMNSVNWTDKDGNFWLFGGQGYDSTGTLGWLNDLWKFDPSTNQWTWMGGSNMIPSCNTGDCGQAGIYGAQGTPVAANIPGARYSASGWTDSAGNLWLFGGEGFDSSGTLGLLDDLWKFNPSTKEWTWVSGNSTDPASCSNSLASQCGTSGVYGISHSPAPANMPGAREGGISWTDSQGNLWLFGGDGIDAAGKDGYLDDLWVYSPSTQEWTWMSGSSTVSCVSTYCGQPGVYGTLQAASLGNTPSGRAYSASWTDASGNLWLFGGTGINVVNNWGMFQDLWEFQIGTGGLPVTATPTFSPSSGTYATIQTVSIEDTTPGATIYYLIDGNTPAMRYTAPITVSSSETIEAVAEASGYANSAVASATYSMQISNVATPSFSPVSGTYSTSQTVTISDTTSGTTIYYTTDGTLPTTSSNSYSGPINVSSTKMITAIAVANGLPNSATASAVYTLGPDTSAGKWTWMGGSYLQNQAGQYGTLQTAAAGNMPGARDASTSWTDQSGILWLFGGDGYDANDTRTNLNDLWEFNPSTKEWAWMGGSSTVSCSTLSGVNVCHGPSGVYGILGAPAAGNTPGGRSGSVGWTDSGGHRWLFGGYGVDANGDVGLLNDLWEFDPSTLKWTWMGGSNVYQQGGVYGTLGVPAPGNTPGARSGAVSWVDNNGNFWLFGGSGLDGIDQNVTLNDLWEFDPSTKEWAWMGGNNEVNILVGTQPAAYGTQGVPAPGNIPGSLTGAMGWTDSNGDLWLFGDGNLWEYSPSSKEWAWMSGIGPNPCPFNPLIGYTNCTSQPGAYGTLGVPDARNSPAGGGYAAAWTDQDGNFWLLGGDASDVTGENNGFYKGDINALWDFSPSRKQWAWMGGDYAASNCSLATYIGTPILSVICDGSQGVFGSQSITSASNIPSARRGAVSWTDKNGNLWLFSGADTNLSDAPGYVNDLWEYQPSTTTLPSAATPIFSLKPGVYATGGPLILSNGMENARIYYTTDGSVPTASSNLYGGPIMVTSAVSIKAIAMAPGYRNSSVVSATYYVPYVPVPATPSFSPPSGSFTSAQQVIISEATSSATVFYSTNGTTPTLDSPVYVGPITVSPPQTIMALAAVGVSGNAIFDGIDMVNGGGAVVSPIAKATYAVSLTQAQAPTFSVLSGVYTTTQTITISDATPGAAIYYTTDGTTPTANSTPYTSAIPVASSETLKAIAVADGYASSSVSSAAYSISQPSPFTFATSTPSLAIHSGGQGSVALTVMPQSGFNTPISFSCSSGLPAGVTCSFSPATITPSGTAATTTLTITSSAQTAALRRGSGFFLPATTFAAVFCLFGWRRRRRLQIALLLAVSVIGLGLVSGCGGSGSGGASGGGSSATTPVISTVTITATAGSLQQTAVLSLTVD